MKKLNKKKSTLNIDSKRKERTHEKENLQRDVDVIDKPNHKYHSKRKQESSCKNMKYTKDSIGRLPISPRIQATMIKSMQHQNNNSLNVKSIIDSQQCKRNRKGETDLHLAAIKNDVIKITELLKRNIDPNITDYSGWTALHEACNRGYVECASEILKFKCDVNAIGPNSMTPLHDACYNGHSEVAKVLIESGADYTLKDDHGRSSLDIISESNELSSDLRSLLDEITSSSFLQCIEDDCLPDFGDWDILSLPSSRISSPFSQNLCDLDNNVLTAPISSEILAISNHEIPGS